MYAYRLVHHTLFDCISLTIPEQVLALLGSFAPYAGRCLPTFPDNLSASIFKGQVTQERELLHRDGRLKSCSIPEHIPGQPKERSRGFPRSVQ